MDDDLDPLHFIKHRLHNWARWSHYDVMPDLTAKLSSLWSQWLPSQAWDAGWGDIGAPEEIAKSINEMDAEHLDRAIRDLGRVHRQILKRHYVEHIGQTRASLDAACRALLDVMQ
jgi:hypothetical protein